VYHALNRAVGRSTVFEKVEDYAAFEKVLEEAGQRAGMRLLGFCVMPNHWHLILVNLVVNLVTGKSGDTLLGKSGG
jgi:putative transposase